MDDYADLINRLRNDEGECGVLGKTKWAADFALAADAIEKLQAYVALYKDCGETAMRVVEQYKAAYIAEHDARTMEYKTDKDKQSEEARAEIIRRFRLFDEEEHS